LPDRSFGCDFNSTVTTLKRDWAEWRLQRGGSRFSIAIAKTAAQADLSIGGLAFLEIDMTPPLLKKERSAPKATAEKLPTREQWLPGTTAAIDKANRR
jgi:hypothetical protein